MQVDRSMAAVKLLAVLAALLLPLQASAQVQDPPYTIRDGKVDDGTYIGWRLFQSTCSRCHGSDALGTTDAPNLLQRVRDMDQARFVGVVLKRYKIVTPRGEASSAAREALIADILQRREGSVSMPSWEGDPNVQPHVLDLYAYLRARSDSVLDDRRPERSGR